MLSVVFESSYVHLYNNVGFDLLFDAMKRGCDVMLDRRSVTLVTGAFTDFCLSIISIISISFKPSKCCFAPN